MSHSTPPRLVLLCLALALLTSGLDAQTFPQTETIVSCSTGATPIGYGEHVLNCSLAVSTFHTYQFMATSGDQVRFSIVGTTLDYDPNYRLFYPNGSLAAQSWCIAGASTTCTSTGGLTLLATGTYTLVVGDYLSNDAGTYDLSLHRLWPSPTAPLTTYGSTIADDITPAGDLDAISFFGQDGDLIRLTLEGTTAGFDTELVLRDPTGSIIKSGWCNSTANACTIMIAPFFLSETGSYTVYVNDRSQNDTGSYELFVDCLLGPSCGGSVTRSYSGSNEDFNLLTSVGASAPPTTFPDRKPASAGDLVTALLVSPNGTLAGKLAARPLLAAQVVTTAGGPVSHGTYPELWLQTNQSVILYDGTSGVFGQTLSASGLTLQYPMPAGLGGFSAIFQGFLISTLATNGFFVASDAHEIML